MNLYEYTSPNGKTKEVKLPGHLNEFEFSQKCKQEGSKIVPGSVKFIYEAQRFKNRQIEFIRCHKTTFGAKPVTIGVVE